VSKLWENPICENQIEPITPDNGKRAWRRTPRRFCSDQCKMDSLALRRAARVLWPLGPQRTWQIVRALGNPVDSDFPHTGDKAKGEIGKPRAI